MDSPVLITPPEQLQEWVGGDGPASATGLEFRRDQPDAHWVWLDRDGRPAARCSLWWRNTPPHPGHRVGLIGHYSAANDRAAAGLLAHACQQLAQRGATLAVGPMDGNTWRPYRFVTDLGVEPPFFLEPSQPPDWPAQWTARGFQTLATYSSRLHSDLSQIDPRGQAAGDRLRALGVRLRTLALERLEQELMLVYPMLAESFQRGLLYSPIGSRTFVEQFASLRSCLRSELVLVAEHAGEVVGLVFCLPNVLQAARGDPIDTAIIKTLAISPKRTYGGLGSYLALEVHQVARAMGYNRVIHALMRNSNKSQSISARYGPVMRRYALYAKTL